MPQEPLRQMIQPPFIRLVTQMFSFLKSRSFAKVSGVATLSGAYPAKVSGGTLIIRGFLHNRFASLHQNSEFGAIRTRDDIAIFDPKCHLFENLDLTHKIQCEEITPSVGFRLLSKIGSGNGTHINVKIDDLIFVYKNEWNISICVV